jgi:hypothetical protein
MPRKEGQFLVEDFYTNLGGLNTADSPFVVSLNEATGGKNYDYVSRGGLKKRAGHGKLNTSANAQVKSLGLGLWNKPGTARKVIRAAGRKLQDFDVNTYAFTNLTEDTTAAGSDFLGVSSTQPVVFTMFNTSSAGVLWAAGGGATSIYGAYSGTKVTKNGVETPGGSISLSTSAHLGTPNFSSTGYYRYAVAFRKASTQAIGNAALFKEVQVSTSTDKVTIDLSSVTGEDTTKHDKFVIYRSAVSASAQGDTAFTAGDLVGYANIGDSSFEDTGGYTATSQNIPQANNVLLDNSELPSGTPKCLTLFKRRLVTAINSTVYFSDLNKPESWPTYQTITLPSGGDITALGVISMTSATSSQIEEMLVVFKQREVWVITGDGTLDDNGIPDWSLKYINSAGAPSQASVVSADGFLFWLNYRGFYMWNGNGKPAYISRKIQDKFQRKGDIDKGSLVQAWGAYAENRGQIHWCVTSKAEGTQKYLLKLDVDLTTKGSSDATGNISYEGVFTPDVLGFSAYAGLSFIASDTSTEETVYYGDGSGYIYSGYTSTQDGGVSVDWEYITPHLNLSTPNMAKRLVKVVAWVIDNGEYDLNLTYWSNYGYRSSDASSVSVTVNQGRTGSDALYGTAIWGTSTYNSFKPRIKPVVFNIPAGPQNNAEGESFRLRFQQLSSTKTLTLYGFSVYFSEIALRK